MAAPPQQAAPADQSKLEPGDASASAVLAGESTSPTTDDPPHLSPLSTPSPAPRPTLRREWLLLSLAVLLLVGIVVPPLVNLGRYQRRIVAAMSRSLGRPVTMRAISLRLLPAPALVLSDVVVNEEAEFGGEPALRAPEVIAELRLTSLWRGRFEVSRVEMSDASLNLIRSPEGRWNIGTVLLQASHVANAPTRQRRPGTAPRFPYIEISDSRVNIKQGAEKLPYSLLNANLSMWLAEPELYQLKLDGQPVRTDLALGLSDTGLLRIEGTLHRATAFGRMPLALHADWASAPLGQVGRLMMGRDPGWRGDLHASADVSGELDSLAVRTHLVVANLHRQEFTPAEPFSIDATCRALYQRRAGRLDDLACRWPVGDGQLLLAGTLARDAGETSDLQFTADRLPASFLLAAAAVARSDFAPQFRLRGDLQGSLSYTAAHGSETVYAGTLEAPRLEILGDEPLKPLVLTGASLAASRPAPTEIPTLLLTADPVDLDGPTPTRLSAQLTAQGFLLHASGSATVARLLEIGRATHMLPIAIAQLAPQGTAEFDVTRTAPWQEDGGSGPSRIAGNSAAQLAPARLQAAPLSLINVAAATSGWLRLRAVEYQPSFLALPVTVPAAQATFSPGGMDWSVPAVVFGRTHLQLTATYPLECGAPDGCPIRFRAFTPMLDAGEIHTALSGSAGQEGYLLHGLLSRLTSRETRWPALDGSLRVDNFLLGRLALHDASAAVVVHNGEVTLSGLNARALGGTLHGSGTLGYQGGAPRYGLNSTLTRASAAAIGNLFHENWGPGSLTLSSEVNLSGVSPAELIHSARGSFHAEWLHGALGSGTPLTRFTRWNGTGSLDEQGLTITDGQLIESNLPRTLQGRIGFDRSLDLRLGEQNVPVTGTISHPAE